MPVSRDSRIEAMGDRPANSFIGLSNLNQTTSSIRNGTQLLCRLYSKPEMYSVEEGIIRILSGRMGHISLGLPSGPSLVSVQKALPHRSR